MTASLTTFARNLSEVVDLTIKGQLLDAEAKLRLFSSVGDGVAKTLRARHVQKNIDVPSTERKLRMPAKAFQASVFIRDRYFCRYCNKSTVALPVMNAIAAIYPMTYRLHPHWKATETDVSFWIDMASLDHIIPLTRGGTNETSNLATSCWRCNELKGGSLLTEIGWTIQRPQAMDWDGLSSKLADLVAVIPDGHIRYRAWVEAFEAASMASRVL